MVKRDPSPRKGNFMSRRGFLEVGTLLGITALVSACSPSGDKQGPTPAPTTSSADKTPGTTSVATESGTKTPETGARAVRNATIDKLEHSDLYASLSPEMKNKFQYLHDMDLTHFEQQPLQDRLAYAQFVYDTYHDMMKAQVIARKGTWEEHSTNPDSWYEPTIPSADDTAKKIVVQHSDTMATCVYAIAQASNGPSSPRVESKVLDAQNVPYSSMQTHLCLNTADLLMKSLARQMLLKIMMATSHSHLMMVSKPPKSLVVCQRWKSGWTTLLQALLQHTGKFSSNLLTCLVPSAAHGQVLKSYS